MGKERLANKINVRVERRFAMTCGLSVEVLVGSMKRRIAALKFRWKRPTINSVVDVAGGGGV